MARLPVRPSEAGFTLLEVVVALALLGVLCAGAFGVLAAGLRASRAATNYTTAVLEGERILNDVLANGMAIDMKEGVSESGYRWKAERILEPSENVEGPAQLLRWQVSVWWPASRGMQQLDFVAFTMTENQAPPTDAGRIGSRTPEATPQGGRL